VLELLLVLLVLVLELVDVEAVELVDVELLAVADVEPLELAAVALPVPLDDGLLEVLLVPPVPAGVEPEPHASTRSVGAKSAQSESVPRSMDPSFRARPARTSMMDGYRGAVECRE
jgi:hypothetical protein